MERLIELAFDYVAAETEHQAKQVYNQAALLTTETTTLKAWLDLIDHIKVWNNNHGYEHLMNWAGALQFLSTKHAEMNSSQTEDQ